MNLETNYNIIFPVICNFCHYYYDTDEYINLNELEDQLMNSDFVINEEFIESIINSLNSINDLSDIKYLFTTEDYWLDDEESIYVKVLVISDKNDIELYRVQMDEFNDCNSITIFIRILLYIYEIIDVRKQIFKFLPNNLQ